MEPVAFEEDETAFLPPHEFVTYAKDQPEYRPLPVVQLHGPECRTISRWTLTPAEREAVAKGEDLYLEQLLFRDEHGTPNPLQPILPTVGLRDFCPADKVQ